MTVTGPDPVTYEVEPPARQKRVLVVDDDDGARRALVKALSAFGHDVTEAESGREALARLSPSLDLVILDARMPGMNGFEVALQIRQDPEYLNLPIVMVTGHDSREERLHAVEAGVNDFLSKPFDITELRLRSQWLLRMKEATDTIKRHRAELELAVERRTAELRLALDETAEAKYRIEEAHLDTIRRLVLAAEFKDRATAGHIERIGRYCELLATGLGLPPRDALTLRHASPMHDVGKIGIPDAILTKPGKLDAPEWEIMKQHTTMGARILGGSPSELLQVGEVIALTHHERWNGTGYPSGTGGSAIPLPGRICAVADVFDALTNERQYRGALPNDTVYSMMRAESGKHFDTNVLEVFFDYLREVEAIQEELRT